VLRCQIYNIANGELHLSLTAGIGRAARRGDSILQRIMQQLKSWPEVCEENFLGCLRPFASHWIHGVTLRKPPPPLHLQCLASLLIWKNTEQAAVGRLGWRGTYLLVKPETSSSTACRVSSITPSHSACRLCSLCTSCVLSSSCDCRRLIVPFASSISCSFCRFSDSPGADEPSYL